MSANHLNEDHVLIRLSTLNPECMAYPERAIVLTESNSTIPIGRASSRLSLGLLSDPTNGWFDSPVMSRKHATLTANIADKTVYVEDTGSMHGSSLNGDTLVNSQPQILKSGDKLGFGTAVYRNGVTFQPTDMMVSLQFHTAPRSTTSPSRIFTVPDDCSTDENEPLDDDLPLVISEGVCSTLGVTATQQDSLAEPSSVPQLDGPADVDTTVVEAPETVAASLESARDDDQSICLTESTSCGSEYSCQSPPESRPPNMDMAFKTYDEDESGSGSWNYSSGDETNEDNVSEDASSVQEGVFIYDCTDSDQLDTDHELDPFEDSEMDPIDDLDDFESEELVEIPTTPYHPASVPSFTLPSTNTALLSSLSAHGATNTSNAALPYMLRRAGDEDFGSLTFGAIDDDINKVTSTAAKQTLAENEVSCQSLGQLSGKPDFFQARERNKTIIAEARMVPLDHSQLGQNYMNLLEWEAASAYELQQLRIQQQQREQNNPLTDISGLSARSGAQSLADAVDTNLMEAAPRTLQGASSPFPQQFFMKANEGQENRSGPSQSANRDVEETPELPPPQFSRKGKRKADEISSLSKTELDQYTGDSWGPTNPEGLVVSTPPPVEQPPTANAQAGLPSPPNTPDSGPRSNKRIKRFAERVGFAALGGATVGALVFSSLIYTAPTFV